MARATTGETIATGTAGSANLPAAGGSMLYMLERFDVGIVQLDRALRVVAMNEFARSVLPVEDKQPFDKVVTSFHPDRSQPKVRFLLEQAECPVSNPPPMTMIINIPERVLLIKVSKLMDSAGTTSGFTLVFYDITDAVSREDVVRDARRAGPAGHAGPAGPETDAAAAPGAGKRRLLKIPTTRQSRIVLVDTETVSHIRSEGHYTWVQTPEGRHFCNLNIGDLEERLDPERFLRVHRSYIVNLGSAMQIDRQEGRTLLRLADAEGTEIPVARSSVARLMERLGLAEAGRR